MNYEYSRISDDQKGHCDVFGDFISVAERSDDNEGTSHLCILCYLFVFMNFIKILPTCLILVISNKKMILGLITYEFIKIDFIVTRIL